MSNETVVIVAKDADYDLGQLECFLPPWCLKINSNQLININIIYDNLGRKISDLIPQQHTDIGSDTKLHKFNVVYVLGFKKVCKDPFSLTLIKRLRLSITLAEKIVRKAKIFVQTVMCNGKLNKNHVLTRVWLYENLKPKSSCYFHQIQIHILKNKTCLFAVPRLAECF